MALEDYGLITGMEPSLGWVFAQQFGDRQHPITGTDGPGLVRNVILFRIHQRIEIGDVEFEVAEQVKKNSPQNDRFKGKRYQPKLHPFVTNFERMRRWMVAVEKTRPRLVGVTMARERGTACIGCPQNVGWKVHCEPCNESVVYSAKALRQHAEFELDDKLNCCRLHGVSLQAAVFMDQSDLPPRHPEAPAQCWVPADEATH